MMDLYTFIVYGMGITLSVIGAMGIYVYVFVLGFDEQTSVKIAIVITPIIIVVLSLIL